LAAMMTFEAIHVPEKILSSWMIFMAASHSLTAS
jgi:hypothetical protein